MKALVRGNHSISKAAFAAAVVIASGFTAATASAADDVVSELKPGLFLYKSGVVGMAPIPNEGAQVAAATTDAGVEMAPAADITDKDEHCLATAIYFEARGESEKGQAAVAEVILARTRTPGRPKTVCGVVYEGSNRKSGCQFSFTCDRASDVVRDQSQWAVARRIAEDVITSGVESLVNGATFYHATYVKPRWARSMVRVAQIGSHIFYRPRNGRLL